jgi:hypothetical protein
MTPLSAIFDDTGLDGAIYVKAAELEELRFFFGITFFGNERLLLWYNVGENGDSADK